MPQHLHLDFETFSLADLKAVGAYRYAFDPSTEILCAAMALGDEQPWIWTQNHGTTFPDEIWDALENPEVLIYAHNAQFEMAICQALLWKTWGTPCPDLSRFRCTVSLARRAALPGKLEKLAEVLGLEMQKDKRGTALVKKFSEMQDPKKPTKKNPDGIPARRIRSEDEPEAFAEFLAYCQQDVRTEQEVARRLAYFDDDLNNSNYSLDARINARGVPVNLDGLQKAQRLVEEETQVISEEFRQLTGFEVTQGAKLLAWLHGQGVHLDDLQADTLEEFLEKWNSYFVVCTRCNNEGVTNTDADIMCEGFLSCPACGGTSIIEPPIKALRLKQLISYASIKKIPTMIACAGPHDNRIRGMLSHHGATTGRWTASLVQFQNMKRPTIKFSEDAYREICEGISRDMLEINYGPVIEVISSCIRHFVHNIKEGWQGGKCLVCEGYGVVMEERGEVKCAQCGGTGDAFGIVENNFLDADYSAIEARIICWLAGQEDALDEYRQGVDRYKVMASFIYGIPVDKVNKFPQRYIGKQTILGCGFGMGSWKFRKDCLKKGGYDLPLGLEEVAVMRFRAKHKKVVSLWRDIKTSAVRAVANRGMTVPVGKHLAFKCVNLEGMDFLLMRLPSGRKLSYPQPRIVNGDVHIFRKLIGTNWGHQEVNGCTFAENATQAVAADIMANGSHNAENAGYEIATLIHDQALAYYREGQTPERFVQLLTDLPAWAEGLPIEAEGSLVPFYKKD